MPGLEPLAGLRVVATPAALEGARWSASAPAEPVTILRFAPDEAFAIGATSVALDDPDAIVEPETAFVGRWCPLDDIRGHMDWLPPVARPVLAQGAVAGVPAKVWMPDGGGVLVLTQAAYADTLARRLGWSS